MFDWKRDFHFLVLSFIETKNNNSNEVTMKDFSQDFEQYKDFENLKKEIEKYGVNIDTE